MSAYPTWRDLIEGVDDPELERWCADFSETRIEAFLFELELLRAIVARIGTVLDASPTRVQALSFEELAPTAALVGRVLGLAARTDGAFADADTRTER